MKKLVSRTLILSMVLGFGLAAFAAAEDGTWTGWVTETHCAAAGAKVAHADCAGRRGFETGEYFGEGRLAAAGFPNDGQRFALFDVEAQMSIGHHAALAGAT